MFWQLVLAMSATEIVFLLLTLGALSVHVESLKVKNLVQK